jgi:hypothetical protein
MVPGEVLVANLAEAGGVEMVRVIFDPLQVIRLSAFSVLSMAW